MRVPEGGDDRPEDLRRPGNFRTGPVHEREGAGVTELSLLVERAPDRFTQRQEQAVRGQGLCHHDRCPIRDSHVSALRFCHG